MTSARSVEVFIFQKFITDNSVAAEFVFVTGNWISRARRVHSVVIDGDEINMPIDERHYAFGVIVERLVLSARPAAVPREWRANGPLRNEQSERGVFDRAHNPARDVRITRQVHTIKYIAAVIKFC